MNYKQPIFYTMLGIIFIGMGFIAGYIIGNAYTSKTEYIAPSSISEYSDLYTSPPEETPTPLPSADPGFVPYYTVQCSEKFLIIYEMTSDGRRVIKEFPVNTDMLPNTDKEMLSDGITAYTLTEAYEIAENYTN